MHKQTQKTIVTIVSAAASLMLIAGTLAPIAYGDAVISATEQCVLRAGLTGDEIYDLAPQDVNAGAQQGNSQQVQPAGTIFQAPNATNPPGYMSTGSAGNTVITPNWGILCTYGTIKQISQLLFLIVGVLAVVMIVTAAVMYISAGQNPARAQTAHTALMWAIVGMIVAIAARIIPNIALSLMGIH